MPDYEKEEYWGYVQEFIIELKTAKYWCKPDGNPKKEWKLFEADTRAVARDAARDAARAAAGAAAWAAARDAARDAARAAAWAAARDAARDAAWDAARDAARVAALAAARDAARDAAWDAAIFAKMLICIGLDIKLEHLLHLNARMDVWRKGYCLLCDVNGVLYVYAAKNTKND